MKKILTAKDIENFKTDGAIVLRKKFDISWIKKLKTGIKTEALNQYLQTKTIWINHS